MSINLDNIKSIVHNNKNVILIKDSQNRVIWRKSDYTQPYLFMCNSSSSINQNLAIKAISLNIENSQSWVQDSNIGPAYSPDGNMYWSDGTDLYYSYNNFHCRYDGDLDNYDPSDWTDLSQTWNITWLFGNDMVKINNTIYNINWNQSGDALQILKFDSNNNSWVNGYNDFNNFPVNDPLDFERECIWTDGDDIYYQITDSTISVLDQSTMTWGSPISTGNLTTSYGTKNYWKYGSNVYYSEGTTHYIWNKNNKQWISHGWSSYDFYGSDVFIYNNTPYRSSWDDTDQKMKIWKYYNINGQEGWTQLYDAPIAVAGIDYNLFEGYLTWDLGGNASAHPLIQVGLRRDNI